MSTSQQERTRTLSDNAPVELKNSSVSAIALITKSAGQVKHKKNAKEGESAIVFGTSDTWKRKPRSNGKRAKSAIVFVNKKVEPWFHPWSGHSGSARVVVVLAEATPSTTMRTSALPWLRVQTSLMGAIDSRRLQSVITATHENGQQRQINPAVLKEPSNFQLFRP
ncbi:hypothetical protein JG687_00018196 [Phytophthora cactorum]|uniref:Uncharacterized protein n=1 Tax=Phytophthora cactorum TaxID=29920 RepID=A0A8T1TPG1_9STRA|nr:hypothetical protein JG687_00018196 [Phytophthora cactorum]